ncbi:MAG: hypothetical protein B5M53_04305 [Candidatus Cloacimonas sp. 4484_209]|nr:MAG: hypothetical protein B5M53_04305 [Candidatus Cloacimonas sp. 4484_209]
MIRKFVNRREELEFLERAFREDGLKVVILYGRRRVGKTEIINQFCKNKPHIYFLADKRGTLINSREFAAKSARYFDDLTPEVQNFDDVFDYISKRLKNRRVIIAIDEFSHLVEKDDSIPSVFQKIVDEHLKETKLYLIFCGSSISMMEKGVLSYKSPLYGRRTGQWKITPLKFRDSWLFLPKYSLEEFIRAFSVVGNIPAYLLQFDDSVSVYTNIKNRILKKGNLLYEETEFILREELREPSVYMSIIGAITAGMTRVTEIANRCYMNAKDIPKYLRVLQKLHIIHRVTPVTERRPETKKAIYQVSDNFFRFWFRFVYPSRSDLESGQTDIVFSRIRAEFDSYVGRIFEQVCKEFLIDANNRGHLPFHFTNIGRWWHKDNEIDIIALDRETKEILFTECKWSNKRVGIKTYRELKEKSKLVNWFNDERKEYFAIFSRSGFKPELRNKDVLLFDLNDIKKSMSKKGGKEGNKGP